MALYPQSFIDDLRLQADIVAVVQDVVTLKRVGNRYRGLCPFHGEKTPSFYVNREQGFFHCFGCQVGGDVFKFVELHEKLSFPETVKLLAQRFGLPLPEMAEGARDPAVDVEREALLKMHELATALYQETLAGPGGRRGRQMLEDRGLTAQTIDRLQLGFAPPGRDGLARHLRQKGFQLPEMLRSGLVMDRDGGAPVDRFRNRLMIPIAREGGSIVAFGGRSMDADTQPKYLNSPETPIYSKGRTLYGLNLTKGDVRRLGYAVLVEGYFDFAQVLQEGASAVVATCGTALTPAQVHLLRRFAAKAVLSFDPDAAGQGAAVRSCELLVQEGFQVSVAVLPAGEDPDTFIKRHGGPAYQDQLKTASPYLDFLLDRTAAQHDLQHPESRLAFLNAMLAVAAQIPNAAARDQFADRLAHRAGVGEEVVRDEIRKAAVARKPALATGGTGAGTGTRLPGFGELTPAERDLLAGLLLEPETVMSALDELDDRDMQGLSVQPILVQARELAGQPPETIPATLLERLNEGEVALITGIAARIPKPAPAQDCVRALRRRRYERERAAVQREIDKLQERGAPADVGEIDRLWAQKRTLITEIEALS
jgi:DNA primase